MATAKLYIAAGFGLVIASLLVAVFIYRGNAISARAEAARLQMGLDLAVAVNAANKATIERLTVNRALDDKLLVDLQTKLQGLANQTDSAFSAVRQLEKSNATVADYLRTALPDELKRLLDKSGRGGTPNSDGGTAAPVTR